MARVRVWSVHFRECATAHRDSAAEQQDSLVTLSTEARNSRERVRRTIATIFASCAVAELVIHAPENQSLSKGYVLKCVEAHC